MKRSSLRLSRRFPKLKKLTRRSPSPSPQVSLSQPL